MTIRCIVCEDEKILRSGLILTTDWASLNCEVIGEAENGEQALEMIKRLSPDLVVTDIRMPLLDGLELIKATKDICDAEFLIISGYNDFEFAKQAIRLNVIDYITKPIDDEELYNGLRQAVEKVLRKKQDSCALPSSISPQFEHFAKSAVTSKNRYITNAIMYIEAHYQENLSIKDVCKSLLISESYLTKLFKENTNYSFVDYLTNYRIKKACELLKNPDIKIYVIAEQIGYRDQRYFSVLFKKTVGLTPKQFRESQQRI